MPVPNEPHSTIVWRSHDGEALAQKLRRVLADAPGREQRIESILETFSQGLKEHPSEWPIARRSSPEHSFQFCGVEIRYRVSPSDRTVEILTVSALSPHDHPPS